MQDYLYVLEAKSKNEDGHWYIHGIFDTPEQADAGMDELLADPLNRYLGGEYKIVRQVLNELHTYYTMPDNEFDEEGFIDKFLINGDVPAVYRRPEKAVPLNDDQVVVEYYDDVHGSIDFVNLDDDGLTNEPE